jgi:predicted alpha/beta-fold hydrolase
LYNARATWDVRQVVKWLKKSFPNRPLFGLGFSLGANILTNYVGEEGSDCLLKAALICSNPFNLEVCSKILQSSFIGKEVYLRVMGMAMYQLANHHKKEIQEWTDVDWDVIERMKYLHEFDREVQCKTWGYPTEYAYYRDASSSDSIMAIRIPFFAIHATDDPIAPNAAVPYEEFATNPCTVLCTTSIGGHLSWFESKGGRWYAKPVCNFLNYMAFEANLEKITPLQTPETGELKHGHHFEPMRRRMQIHDGDSA